MMKQDRVVFISVSWKSQNLINGMKFAKSNSIRTASLTGASEQNYIKVNSDFSLWVNSKAYNIVESIHTIWITLIIDLSINSTQNELFKTSSLNKVNDQMILEDLLISFSKNDDLNQDKNFIF